MPQPSAAATMQRPTAPCATMSVAPSPVASARSASQLDTARSQSVGSGVSPAGVTYFVGSLFHCFQPSSSS